MINIPEANYNSWHVMYHIEDYEWTSHLCILYVPDLLNSSLAKLVVEDHKSAPALKLKEGREITLCNPVNLCNLYMNNWNLSKYRVLIEVFERISCFYTYLQILSTNFYFVKDFQLQPLFIFPGNQLCSRRRFQWTRFKIGKKT